MSDDELGTYISRGIIVWGDPVRHILEDGDLLINQIRTSELTPQLVALLLEGWLFFLLLIVYSNM